MKIISRKEARLKGELYYFTGKPCKRGHISKRMVRNGTCVSCDNLHRNKIHKEKPRIYNALERAEYRQNNLKHIREYEKSRDRRFDVMKRYTAKLQRTPVWADLNKIKEIYANCPPGYEVDHIIPLQGELVSGLHVPNNLQYLTKSENCSKGNRYEIK